MLEKALVENSLSKVVFSSSVLCADGKIVTQDDEDIETLISERIKNKRHGISVQIEEHPEKTRGRLDNVSQGFVTMDVSDEETLEK